MKKFLFKGLLIAGITVLILFIKIIASDLNDIKKFSFKSMPLNNVSDSQCFKAKIDQLVGSDKIKKCSFFIAGSSMSLCNISGKVIHDQTKETVYNISSWSFKTKQLNDLLKILKTDSVKHFLVAFNNIDFSKKTFEIDFKSADSYINGNKFVRYMSIISKFNLNTFVLDWNYHCKFSDVSNVYESLNFDEYGSIQFEHPGFVIDKARWTRNSNDTAGFYCFKNDLKNLDSYCIQHRIELMLVYLPSRPGSLKDIDLCTNRQIAAELRKSFGKSFWDLHNIEIPVDQYCDGIHMFKNGAASITSSIMDSLHKRH
jgi:hypothetical protein